MSSTALSGTNKVQFSNGDVLGFNQTGTAGPLRGITTPASMQRVRMVTYFVAADGIYTPGIRQCAAGRNRPAAELG